jgi:hypothetical protein
MSKTKEYGWNIPDDVHVEVNGETLPVPEVDDFTRDSIISLSDNEDNLRDLRNVIRWLKSRSDKEIAAAFQYLLDRWTWETGSPTDKFFYGMLEDECRDRKILMEKIKPLVEEYMSEAQHRVEESITKSLLGVSTKEEIANELGVAFKELERDDLE